MKTTEEWFNELKIDYREKALNNMVNPKMEHYSLAGAISNGFVWEKTPEGKDYWNGVFRELMYGEKFDPLQITILEKIDVVPAESVIDSGYIEIDNIKPTILITESSEEPNLIEEEEMEKGGNLPDLINLYKLQKENTK